MREQAHAARRVEETARKRKGPPGDPLHTGQRKRQQMARAHAGGGGSSPPGGWEGAPPLPPPDAPPPPAEAPHLCRAPSWDPASDPPAPPVSGGIAASTSIYTHAFCGSGGGSAAAWPEAAGDASGCTSYGGGGSAPTSGKLRGERKQRSMMPS